MSTPKPRSGYAYTVETSAGLQGLDGLAGMRDEDWTIVVFTPTGEEDHRGTYIVDGVQHDVWWSPTLGALVAQVRR